MTIDEFKSNYNKEEGKIKTKNGTIYLSFTENEIVKLLIENYNKIVRTETICSVLHEEELDYYYLRSIAANIARVRKKLKGIAIIKNRVRFGYKIIMGGTED